MKTVPWLSVIFFLVVWGLTTHGKFSASGDEPHYLIVAESLAADGDLALANNYARDDGRLFGHAGLINDGHARLSHTGQVESVHDIGLPLMLVGPYTVAQRASVLIPEPLLRRFRMDRGLFTYSLLSLLMIVLVAGGAAFLRPAIEALSPSTRYGSVILGAVMLSPPVLSHAFLLFPEAPAFVVTCAVLYMAYAGSDVARSERPPIISPPATRRFSAFAALSLALGVLPWFHRKYTLYIIGLAFVVIWMRANQLRRATQLQLTLLALLIGTPIVLLYAWTWREWGNLAGPQLIEGSRLAFGGVHRGASGLLMDREYGLLAYAPIYLLLPCAVILSASTLWPLLVPFSLLFFPMSAFDEWWGGFSPAARYVMPLVPISAMLMAYAGRSPKFRQLLIVLLVPQLLIDAVVWQHPRWLWPQSTGVNPLMTPFGRLGQIYWTLLPSIKSRLDSPLNAGVFFWIALTGIVVWRVWRERAAQFGTLDFAVNDRERLPFDQLLQVVVFHV